jgi:hypothetical protein
VDNFREAGLGAAGYADDARQFITELEERNR